MSEPTVRAAGLAATLAYAVFIGWAYARQPQTVAQVTGGLAAEIGVYRIDAQAFEDGLRFFRSDRFDEARAAFARADPAERDARTQFYIAYTYCRQGWGLVYHLAAAAGSLAPLAIGEWRDLGWSTEVAMATGIGGASLAAILLASIRPSSAR